MKNVKLLFWNIFDEELQVHLLKSIIDGYLTAVEVVNSNFQFNTPTAKDALPHMRKVFIDYNLLNLPKINNRFTHVEAKPNIAKNCKYVELRTGRFIVTHNYVETKFQHPREAVFRNNYIKRLNPQRDLFIDDDIEENENFYVQLLHGGRDKSANKEECGFPQFVTLGIPSTYTNEWIEVMSISLDLYYKHSFEYVPDQSNPQFNIKIKDEEDRD